MSVLTVKPKFLYPNSRQFPFDEVAEKIVRAIEKRNWKVPGITIEFDTYGSGEAKYQLVRSIKGDYFKLYFCRSQGKLDGRWVDTAALQSICIPGQIIEVHSDESGPTYYRYVGRQWEKDKEWFMNSTKVNAKLNKEPRRYLKYSGRHRNVDGRAVDLAFNSNLGREYEPQGNEPKRINLKKKFEEFNWWLENFVLKNILYFLEAEVINPPVPMEKLIPYKGTWTTVFSICGLRDAERILKGKKNPEDLAPEDRYASTGMWPRLVKLGVPYNGKFPKIVYNGFMWCDVNQGITQNSKYGELSPSVQLAMSWSIDKEYIIAIKPKYANHIYVVDNSKYDETRDELFKAIIPRKRLTDEEVNTIDMARAETLIPINEYKGDYKKPMVVINRELDFDEIEWVTKIKN